MSTNRSRGRRPLAPFRISLRRALPSLAVVLVACLVMIAPASAAAGSGRHIASSHSKVHGLTSSQWLATFYEVGLAKPTSQNPLIGNGNLCPVVHGVLIHFGIFGESCTVPEGTPVLVVSIIAPECSTNEPAEFGAGPDLASLLACARRIRANFRSETMTLDGQPVRRLDRFRVETDRFRVVFPVDNPFDATPGPGLSAAVGTVVIFKNLKPGVHTIVSHLVEHEPPAPDQDVIGTARVVVTERHS